MNPDQALLSQTTFEIDQNVWIQMQFDIRVRHLKRSYYMARQTLGYYLNFAQFDFITNLNTTTIYVILVEVSEKFDIRPTYYRNNCLRHIHSLYL